MAWLAPVAILAFFLGVWFAAWGRHDDLRSAFVRGYCNGWYDGLNGVKKMDHDRKADLFVKGQLGIVGGRRSGSGTSVEGEADG